MNKTITINAAYKEFYYQAPVQECKAETARNQVVWNYMMNLSMQNTISQISKK